MYHSCLVERYMMPLLPYHQPHLLREDFQYHNTHLNPDLPQYFHMLQLNPGIHHYLNLDPVDLLFRLNPHHTCHQYHQNLYLQILQRLYLHNLIFYLHLHLQKDLASLLSQLYLKYRHYHHPNHTLH
ncbi:hypothetical protein FLAT13_03138 [Flavobacterium salmonis]|uniref:Uncharacterized protein n=1 Tax=Flavobacterium salmonis TaxID=2654844 RepID=A0A6V6Z309_9FLAO|nr:hypothetical protein FLAT13_03138 [Flavobacterium salmonis]